MISHQIRQIHQISAEQAPTASIVQNASKLQTVGQLKKHSAYENN